MSRKLYRSRTDSMLAGVCGGLGQYLQIDPTLVRLGFVLTAVFGGHGVLLYLVMCVVVPPEPEVLPAQPPASAEVTA